MSDTKESENKKSEKKEFNCPCCDQEEMAKMMKNFMTKESGNFDCAAMMKKMCGGGSKI